MALAGAVMGLGAASAMAQEKVTVAYFMEWPTANQVAQMDETYDKVMDVDVPRKRISLTLRLDDDISQKKPQVGRRERR